LLQSQQFCQHICPLLLIDRINIFLMILLGIIIWPWLVLGSKEAILITGGSTSGAEDFHAFSSSELLLASCPVASLPRVIYDHLTMTMADGTILTCGGERTECHQLSKDLSSWTHHSNLPASLGTSNLASTVLPSGAYLSGRSTGAFLPTGSNEWNTFSIPSDHEARVACAVPVSSTSFLLIGGYWEQGDFVDEYETLTGEWTRWPPLPEKRENMACVKVGDKVLVIGGYNRALNEYDGGTVILDIETRTWRQGGFMTWERNGHGVSVLESGRVLAYGGGYYGDDGAEEWDPKTETWSPIADKMEVERSNFGSSVINVIC